MHHRRHHDDGQKQHIIDHRDDDPLPFTYQPHQQKQVNGFTKRRRMIRLAKKKRNITRRYLLASSAIAGMVVVVVYYLYLLLGMHVVPNKRPAHPQPRAFVPYPSPDIQISVVIMNYARPRMLQNSELIPTFLAHPAVSEVLLCHANSNTAFALNHVKVKNIDATQKNEELGLALRFYYCTAAENRWVIHVDDDTELDYSTINELIAYMVQDPHRIVGHYARRYNFWKVPHRHGYDYATVLAGPVEVILTKILILERRICRQFMKHAHLMDDMVLEATPRWNGEDIFVNLVANHYYGVPDGGPFRNYAIPDLNVWEASNSYKDDDTGIHDVSGNMDRHSLWNVGWKEYWKYWWKSWGHSSYRGHLWATAKARLAALPPPAADHDQTDDNDNNTNDLYQPV